MNQFYKNIFLVLIIFFLSCQSKERQVFKFNYDINQPINTYTLPPILDEVSGLGFTQTGLLGSVQDELGIIFLYDLEKEKVFRQINFFEPNDYEGIEFVDDTAYILWSEGTITEVSNFGTKHQKVKHHLNTLTKRNDVEGLGFDKQNNRLLLACKRKAGKGYKNLKAIYAIDLTTKEMTEKPILLFDNKVLARYLGEDEVDFNPTAIAVHPINNLYYILSSSDHLILSCTPEGKVMAIKKLPKKLFRQPEGIAFAENGNLLIASEGDGKRGKILQFSFE